MSSGIGGVAFAPQIAAAATRHHLDPRLLAAVAAQETGGPGSDSGANVVGDSGHGHGLFQIDDRYHAFASTPAAMDPAQNADYAAGLLAGLLQRYGGNVHAALSAYNAGSPTATGTTTDWGHGMNVGYADSVMLHYAQLGGNPGSLPGGTAVGPSAGGTTSARDAAVADLPSVLASTNQLRCFASPGVATMIDSFNPGSATTALSGTLNSALGSVAMPVSLPAPSIPSTSQPSQTQQSQQPAPLHEDLGDDGDDADPSQAVASA